ncbi:MAG: Crp/Fnr family transcriptional regulator [Terricaulis sp.]
MSSPQSLKRLAKIDILQSLSESELATLAEALTWLQVRPRQVIVSHLSKERNVYFISEGIFQVGLVTASGRPVAFRKLHAGSHFGELAALTGTPRTTNVMAETAGVLAECTADAFMELLRSSPAFAEAISISLARNVVMLSDRVFELATLEVRFRIYAELLRLGRKGEMTDEGVLVRNAPTHETIAATVGAQREVVTREFRMISEEGIITSGRRQFLIRDIDRLRDMMQRRAGITASQMMDWSA